MLCTHTTDTLMEAATKLVHVIGENGTESTGGHAYALINSQFENSMKSPLDDAILSAPATAARPVAGT